MSWVTKLVSEHNNNSGNSGPDLSEASGENQGYYSVLMLEEPSFREVGETTGGRDLWDNWTISNYEKAL